MKFRTDENLPTEAAGLLRSAGHDAVTVGEQRLSCSVDSAIGSVCEHEQRVLVTLNLDFADIRTYPPGRYPGFVVLRLARQDKASVLRAIGRTIPLLARDQISGRLWIVEEHQVRIHGE
jgi:predicted nuclease of predicted toxin-antitoxin system